MTKYICVQSMSDLSLEKDECFIKTPDFVQDVIDCRYQRPNTNLLSPTYMRAIADYIGYKYDPAFPGSGCMVVQDFNGVPFSSVEDIGKAVVKMFRKHYPKIFDANIDYQIKNRPFGTKLIYFVGDHLDSGMFAKNGIDAIDLKDVDIYMGRKEKKTNKGSFKKIEE